MPDVHAIARVSSLALRLRACMEHLCLLLVGSVPAVLAGSPPPQTQEARAVRKMRVRLAGVEKAMP